MRSLTLTPANRPAEPARIVCGLLRYCLIAFSSCCITSFSMKAAAQDPSDLYLSTHKYALNISDNGPTAVDTLFAKKLPGYKILLLGEGGSHELEFYFPLKLHLLEMLNRTLGVHTFVMEFGNDLSTLFNKYLRTGDSAGYLPHFTHRLTMPFLQSLYAYNQSAGKSNPIFTLGIDFQRPPTYFRALRTFLPPGPVPAGLLEEINTIRTAPDTLDCDAFTAIEKTLKNSIDSKRALYRSYFGDSFTEVYNIIANKGFCHDVRRDRNPNLKFRMELFDGILKDSLYYGELGEAHVNFRLKNFSYLLNTDKNSPFYNKVAVLNVYCYHCDIVDKQVSNWDFNKAQEEEIRTKFLKYCDTDFTLFDLTESAAPPIAGLKADGQFLLVVKNQQ